MPNTFNTATSFNADLAAWDVGSVRSLAYAFSASPADMLFDRDLSAWDVGNIVWFSMMFGSAQASLGAAGTPAAAAAATGVNRSRAALAGTEVQGARTRGRG